MAYRDGNYGLLRAGRIEGPRLLNIYRYSQEGGIRAPPKDAKHFIERGVFETAARNKLGQTCELFMQRGKLLGGYSHRFQSCAWH